MNKKEIGKKEKWRDGWQEEGGGEHNREMKSGSLRHFASATNPVFR